MPSLSTHVLDLYQGTPAKGVKIDVCHQPAAGGAWSVIKTVTTNADGRCDGPVVAEGEWLPGNYELTFHIGDYFEEHAIPLPDPSFLSVVPVRFAMHPDGGHYHVPLLVSPWGYQVYRGS